MIQSKVSPAHAVLLALAIAVCHGQQRFSINSPRNGDNEPTRPAVEPENNNSQEADRTPVLVKLPDDLEAVLNMQKNDRSRIHASILGLNIEDEHLDQILDEGDVQKKPTTTATKRQFNDPITTQPTTASVEKTTRDPTVRRGTTLSGFAVGSVREDNRGQQTTRDEKVSVSEDVPSRSFWAIAWEAHVYFSGTLFILLALYCSINILRLHTFSRLFSRSYFVALNLCLIVVGVLRPIYLFHDPYNEGSTFPRVVAYLLLDTGFPCITTAFAILFLALLRATQIELVSPGFQRPRSLGAFCLIHFIVSISVDLTVGFIPNLRYLVLLCQGFFIVWSLLLSAGYFYAFSSMKKVALRTHADIFRTIYPKLSMDGGTFGDRQRQTQSNQGQHSPLSRAIHLSLGVAVIGSLMGGVQLFGMIKMLGLQRIDMRNSHNEMAWFGYQVSMRILEVTICILLAVIATTPLRSDNSLDQDSPAFGNRGGNICFSCCTSINPRRELEDEIYSEICSNNQSVRQMTQAHQNGLANTMSQGPGAMVIDPNNPYGTLGTRGVLVLNQHQELMQMGPLSESAQHVPGGTGANVLLTRNSTTVNSLGSSSSNPNSTLRSGPQKENNRTSVASSRATLDTALYSNIRSRPSSMLFNDSGFVRFRSNGDPNLGQEEVLKQSSHNLTEAIEPAPRNQAELNLIEKRERLRASQSFDDTVLLSDQRSLSDKLSPASQPDVSPFQKSEEENKFQNAQGLNMNNDRGDGLYEPPPGMKFPPMSKHQANLHQIYSESDIESNYNRSQIYSSRAPSRCSSISATQSFDMRMYGKIRPNFEEDTTSTAAALVGPPVAPGQKFVSATMKRNEDTKEKLENPFYYYGSTRNQKKVKQLLKQQKPRPLLPSQRAQIESQSRLGSNRSQNKGEKLNKGQPVVPKFQPPPEQPEEQSFHRSQSLGGYYNNRQPGVVVPPGPGSGPVIRNQGIMQIEQHQPAGSMTPLTYSRWQHAQMQENVPQRYNPLYGTPPTVRHGAQSGMLEHNQGLPFNEIDGSRYHQQQQRLFQEIRGFVGAQEQLNQRSKKDQLLSPILTDHEASPLHRNHDYLTDDYGYGDDESETDMASTYDQFTSQATQGYSEGLADNESEVSSMFGNDQPQLPFDPRMKKNSHLVSPLEYSAMLKLYNSTNQDIRAKDKSEPAASGQSKTSSFREPEGKKEVTPDSGVAIENIEQKNRRNESKVNPKEKGAKKRAKQSSSLDSEHAHEKRRSRQSLLSSSSSLNDLVNVPKTKQGYARVATNERFSSSSEESEESESDAPKAVFQGALSKPEKKYHPLVSPPSSESNFPAFRWDGSKMKAKKPVKKSSKKGEKPPTSSSSSEEDLPMNAEKQAARGQVLAACREIQRGNFSGIGQDETI